MMPSLTLALVMSACAPAPPEAASAAKSDRVTAIAGEPSEGEPAASQELSSSERATERARSIPPWARQNEARLATLASAIGLSPEERTQIAKLWAGERRDLLQLITTRRDDPTTDWKLVADEVEVLRTNNDTQIHSLLGDARFTTYLDHRPKTSTPSALQRDANDRAKN